MSRSSNAFYQDQVAVALTASFVATDFGFNSINIVLSSDSGTIEYSLNGADVHGRLTNGEVRIMPDRVLRKIYLRGNTQSYRLEVY